MGTLDGEAGDSWPEPGDAVRTVAGIVDWRRAAGGCEKAELVQRDAVEGWKEDFAEGAVGKRVPQLALRTRRGAERHLATRTPHGWCACTSGGLHRTISLERGRGG